MNNDVCVCPSFSSYSSDRLAETALRVAAGDDDFEFALLRDDNYKEVSAAEFHHDGPVFPVFSRDLIQISRGTEQSEQIPLRKLFAEEDRDRAPSCSSSEEDELESVPAAALRQCEKSKSTGSASRRRWKIRDLLLRRSRSDGKESIVFLTPKRRGENPTLRSPEKGRGGEGPDSASAAAREALYVRSRAVKEGEKSRSYLPYRRDLVGLFANVSFSRF
ncbi:hypothetical protein SASPL_151540 [Salvia splendens]|uniref:Uncharacterized protein n=1 Tax=Salvia splendens TaxID=180675 RepID=A0A8X8Z3T2_SALSN|nr:uncharacterized protein LOC121781174 [Salvia splendens]KAG6390062.1 hypothetical protein SASPL_151540 [Salvia splendens]